MATVIDNDITMGLRGMIGREFVFRSMNGKTYVSRAPRKQDKSKETPRQRLTRTTFKEASAWAKRTLLDPERKTYYLQQARELKLPNAYTAAIQDYMRRRRIAQPDTHLTQSEDSSDTHAEN